MSNFRATFKRLLLFCLRAAAAWAVSGQSHMGDWGRCYREAKERER